MLDEVRELIADKDREIEFLRQQLADAQAEIGKRGASTDDALKTIDRVVRSFELQAEANRAAVLGAGKAPSDDQPQPVQVVTEPVDSPHGQPRSTDYRGGRTIRPLAGERPLRRWLDICGRG